MDCMESAPGKFGIPLSDRNNAVVDNLGYTFTTGQSSARSGLRNDRPEIFPKHLERQCRDRVIGIDYSVQGQFDSLVTNGSDDID